MRTIAIACDPNATGLKKIIMEHLTDMGVEIEDFGSDDPIYANVAFQLAEAVAQGKHERGILLCATGIGMCIAANKVYGAYAALCSDSSSAIRARKSNNTNILTIGALVVKPERAKQIVTSWLESEYTPGGRSESKIQRIYAYEKEHLSQ